MNSENAKPATPVQHIVSTPTLRVRDQFVSYQGTGCLAGKRQDFVRLAGCNVRCPLRANCDQPEALGSKGDDKTIANIVGEMKTDWLHITGGEPAEHEHMVALCDAATEAGKWVQVQTSGTIPIKWNYMPFVSVSPKGQKIENVRTSEIVLVASKWMTNLRALQVTDGFDCPVFVIPEATAGNFESGDMFELLEVLAAAGRDARAGLQSHLVWGVA